MTHEETRVERSTPTTFAPVTIRFTFHLGFDVFLAVTAEVIEERDGDGVVSHDVTVLEAIEDNGHFEVPVYERGLEEIRSAIEKMAVECSDSFGYPRWSFWGVLHTHLSAGTKSAELVDWIHRSKERAERSRKPWPPKALFAKVATLPQPDERK